MYRNFIVMAFLLLLPISVMSYPDCATGPYKIVTDADVGLEAGMDVTWYEDTIYVMIGHIYVENGYKLTIEPGTLIWGTRPGSGWEADTTNPGALIIARGGYIDAQGTFDNPIIFTYGGDDSTTADCPDDDADYTDPGDNYLEWQKWGGIIVLGYATINTTTGEGWIEGIPYPNPTGDDGGYGGSNDTDSSGVLRYVSLRHGGHELSDANEINGFTFGGVGSGTVLEFLEVYANYDDGYEWFGGKVNGKHFVASYCRDDCFDHDEGYRGCFQYMYAQYTDETGDKNGEHDGGTDPENGIPLADPHYYNATYIGRGCDATCNNATSTFHIRDNWAGDYRNSLFSEWACWAFYEIENLDANLADSTLDDSEKRLRNGDLIFENNMFYCDGLGTDVWDYVNPTPDKQGYEHVMAYFEDTAYTADGGSGADYYDNHTGPTNVFGTDPTFTSLHWDDSNHELLNPMLASGSPAKGGAMAAIDAECTGYIDVVDYKGAFDVYNAYDTTGYGTCPYDPCAFWIAYWTKIYNRKHVPQQPEFRPGDTNGDETINIFDITHLIGYLYLSGAAPQVWLKTGDANGDGSINIFDITHLISFLYLDGPPPVGCQ